MAPRLQGLLGADGGLDLSLWGAGSLGRALLTQYEGPFTYAPNRALWQGGGLFVAQSQPVIAIRGASLRRLTPASRPAAWASTADAQRSRQGERQTLTLPWGCLIVEHRGADLVIAGGDDQAEAERGLALPVSAIVAEADAYAEGCDRLPQADPVLRSMVAQGVHAAVSSIRRASDGAFAGLTAGLSYSSPARTYFRDGYWTCQLLLQVAPDIVRDEIDLLACGVHADGEAPSGVIVAGPQQSLAWEARRLANPSTVHACAGDWWSDHFDSPLLFVLLIGDYTAATGDTQPATAHWPLVRAIFERYRGLSMDGLPVKPRNDRDWADNVFRSGLVAYDLGLWVGALDVIARLGKALDFALAAAARDAAALGRTAIQERLKLGGGYADYVSLDGFAETHTALDSLTLLRFGAIPETDALATLQTVQEALETRRNPGQPYGDWGVMCAWPPFAHRSDLRSKTAFPYRYHNGADWPWLDGLYAAERLARGLSGWRYPLTRWWETCLANGWTAPVEYFSPPYARGSLLQAWSSLPAAMALKHREVVLRGDPEKR